MITAAAQIGQGKERIRRRAFVHATSLNRKNPNFPVIALSRRDIAVKAF
jgi:hypothetical protein